MEDAVPHKNDGTQETEDSQDIYSVLLQIRNNKDLITCRLTKDYYVIE